MKTYVIGDIHGNIKALVQCMDRSKFDFDKDHLIIIGDVCDGNHHTKECVDLLLKIKHSTFVLGNHDKMFLHYIRTGNREDMWYLQGGKQTLRSYKGNIPSNHKLFFDNHVLYYVLDNKLFVHAGYDTTLPIEDSTQDKILWDRYLFLDAFKNKIPLDITYDKVFIGHTSTQILKTMDPLYNNKVWGIDTGAGSGGKLTIMNIETEEYFQSDAIPADYLTQEEAILDQIKKVLRM